MWFGFRKHTVSLFTILLTLLIAFFPSAFVKFGELIQTVATDYWLPIVIVVIISLQIVIMVMNAKRTSQ